VGSDTQETTFPSGMTKTGIAREMDSLPAFAAATISEVAIYPTALSAARIAAHYAAAGY
jgi:hypothetical protein